MSTAWLICRKDLKARLRDRSALLVGIIVPLGLAFIFNAVFSGGTGGNAVIKLGVADQDGGQAARIFVHDVLGGVAKGGFIAVRAEPHEATLRSLVGKSKLNAAFVIPRGFSAAVESNQPASIEVITNPDKQISAEIARSIAEAYASDLNRVRLSLAVVMTGSNGAVSQTTIQDLANAAGRAEAPVAVLDVTTKTKELNAKSFYAAGMAVFFVFFVVQFGAAGLLEERANGTLARLVAAPISRSAVLAAKMLTSLILGVISMSVLVVATTWLFGASWGNPLGVGVLIVAAVLAALAIMALVATIAKTSEQAGQWQSVVAVVLGLLGGTFFPVSQAPGVLSNLTFLAPQAWFLRGLGDLRGGSLSAVWTPALAMLVFAVIFGGLAMRRLPRMAEV